MPLITLCGAPLSGKTLMTQALVAEIKAKHPDREVFVINYESLRLSRAVVFKDPAAEKKLNGALRAAVERSLTAKKIVILDALNLVKGFRYELYCRTREVKTSHCTIYLPVSRATAEARNTALDRYPPSVFDDLWKRLEVPIDANRWDHPVFTLTEDDAAAGTTVGTTAPASGPGPFAESRCVDIDFTAASATDVPESATAASETVFGSSLAALAARIVESVTTIGAVKGLQSTTQIRLERPTFVLELDRITNHAVRQIIEATNKHTQELEARALAAATAGGDTGADSSSSNGCWLELRLSLPTADLAAAASATAPGVAANDAATAAPVAAPAGAAAKQAGGRFKPKAFIRPGASAAAAAATPATAASGATATEPAAVSADSPESAHPDGSSDTVPKPITSAPAATAVAGAAPEYVLRLARAFSPHELIAWRTDFVRLTGILSSPSPHTILRSFCQFYQAKLSRP